MRFQFPLRNRCQIRSPIQMNCRICLPAVAIVSGLFYLVDKAFTAEPLEASAPLEVTSSNPVTNSIGMKFVLIPAGEFQMGTVRGDADEQPHRVRITRPFYLGVYEVTQSEWKNVMGGNPSYFSSTGGGRDAV